MTQWWPVVAIFVGFAAILVGLVWLGTRARRGVGVVVNIADEVFHPAAHRVRFDIEIHNERMTPMPSPEDKLPLPRTKDRRGR
jgi:hypothetical protein